MSSLSSLGSRFAPNVAHGFAAAVAVAAVAAVAADVLDVVAAVVVVVVVVVVAAAEVCHPHVPPSPKGRMNASWRG